MQVSPVNVLEGIVQKNEEQFNFFVKKLENLKEENTLWIENVLLEWNKIQSETNSSQSAKRIIFDEPENFANNPPESSLQTSPVKAKNTTSDFEVLTKNETSSQQAPATPRLDSILAKSKNDILAKFKIPSTKYGSTSKTDSENKLSENQYPSTMKTQSLSSLLSSAPYIPSSTQPTSSSNRLRLAQMPPTLSSFFSKAKKGEKTTENLSETSVKSNISLDPPNITITPPSVTSSSLEKIRKELAILDERKRQNIIQANQTQQSSESTPSSNSEMSIDTSSGLIPRTFRKSSVVPTQPITIVPQSFFRDSQVKSSKKSLESEFSRQSDNDLFVDARESTPSVIVSPSPCIVDPTIENANLGSLGSTLFDSQDDIMIEKIAEVENFLVKDPIQNITQNTQDIAELLNGMEDEWFVHKTPAESNLDTDEVDEFSDLDETEAQKLIDQTFADPKEVENSQVEKIYPKLDDLHKDTEMEDKEQTNVWGSSIFMATASSNISSKTTFIPPPTKPKVVKKKIEIKALQQAAELAKKEQEKINLKKEATEKRRVAADDSKKRKLESNTTTATTATKKILDLIKPKPKAIAVAKQPVLNSTVSLMSNPDEYEFKEETSQICRQKNLYPEVPEPISQNSNSSWVRNAQQQQRERAEAAAAAERELFLEQKRIKEDEKAREKTLEKA
ncbi:hypothetical protein HK096_001686, partial [Nowakowskiella sp. JEL0078]